MSTPLGEFYASPDPCMAAVAMIVMAGKVVLVKAVGDRAEKETILRSMLARLQQFSIETGHP